MAPPKKDRTRIEWENETKPDGEDPSGFEAEATLAGFRFIIECIKPGKWAGTLQDGDTEYTRGMLGTSLLDAEQKMLYKAHELALATTLKLGAMLHGATKKGVIGRAAKQAKRSERKSRKIKAKKGGRRKKKAAPLRKAA